MGHLTRLTVLFIMAVLAGCTSYKHADQQALTSKLDPTLGVLVLIPEDGRYNGKRYRDSGYMTADAVMMAFADNAKTADLAEECKGEACLRNIDIEKYGYFVKPKILHWEDRATEWSMMSDKIKIQLVIYDAVTRLELARSSYAGSSTLITLGGDHPQDLLAEPTNKYVDSLYR